MPDYLYILKPTRVDMLTKGPTEREVDIVGRHFTYLKDLHERRIVVLAGRTMENNADTIGICVFRAEDEDSARSVMEEDPAVQEGVMTAELRSFGVALGPD